MCFGAVCALVLEDKSAKMACLTNHFLAVSSETLVALANFFVAITLRAVVDLRELCVHI